jgi:HK97 gp10 family phage protein
MANKFDISGLKELQLAMNRLSVDMAGKIARQATAAAAGVVRKAARHNVSEYIDTGNLQAAIVMKRKRFTKLSDEYNVTVRTGKKSDVKKAKDGTGRLGTDAYYGRYIEFGTVKKSARPFLAPALSENIQPATDAMKKRLTARLQKAGAL